MSSYKHFTIEERTKIQESLNKGKKQIEIARELGRNRSSVSREIKRNGSQKGYNWWYATCQYMGRRRKSVRKLRIKCVKVRTFVIEGLKQYWSPEIITQRYKRENPGEKLSHSTLYRAIRNKEFPEVSKCLKITFTSLFYILRKSQRNLRLKCKT
jgi:IS30 family transposase